MSGDLSFDVGRSRWRQSLAVLDRLGVWAALALLIVVASALSPYFFSLNNFLNILNQASVVGVAAVGMTLVMITGGVDLSVGSVISLSADICATVMNGNDSRIGLAVALSIAAGAAVGFVNGVLVAKRNLPSFILTLGAAVAVQGLGLLYTGGTASGAVAPWFQNMIGGRPWATYSRGGARLPCRCRCWAAYPGDQRARQPSVPCRQQRSSRLSEWYRSRSGADNCLYLERRNGRHRWRRPARAVLA